MDGFHIIQNNLSGGSLVLKEYDSTMRLLQSFVIPLREIIYIGVEADKKSDNFFHYYFKVYVKSYSKYSISYGAEVNKPLSEKDLEEIARFITMGGQTDSSKNNILTVSLVRIDNCEYNEISDTKMCKIKEVHLQQ